MSGDAGKKMLIEGLQKAIKAHDKHKETDTALDLHCRPDDCTTGPYLIKKVDRLADGHNLILRWILIQEQGGTDEDAGEPNSISWTKKGVVINGSRAIAIAALVYIILKLHGIAP